MKILIISRNTFPMQSPRAFRTQELSEQLVKMGHSVILYTVQGKYDYSSYMKETGIQLKPIIMKHSVSANDNTGRMSKVDRLFAKLFKKWFYYPDIEFVFRMKDILKAEANVDLLITIAQPHSIHWGVALAKKKVGKNFPAVWIADCGDPFCGSPFGNWPKYMRYFEKKWCRLVDYIAVPTINSIEGYFPEYRNKIHVIPQGFDFSKTPISEYAPNPVPTFIFTGTIHKGRSPEQFMDYLLTLNIDYQFLLYMHSPLSESYEKQSKGKIKYMLGYGRADIIKACSKADFLINVKNPSSVQTPSKLIDYGISKRPILEISDAFSEQKEFCEFMSGNYKSQYIVKDLDSYKIENVANKFLALANNNE